MGTECSMLTLEHAHVPTPQRDVQQGLWQAGSAAKPVQLMNEPRESSLPWLQLWAVVTKAASAAHPGAAVRPCFQTFQTLFVPRVWVGWGAP